MSRFEFYKSERIEFILVSDVKLNFEEHSHSEDFVITLITNGKVYLERGGFSFVENEGEYFIIKPYENHALFSNEPISVISMCIKKSAVNLFGISEYRAYINSSLTSWFVLPYKSLFVKAADEIYRAFHNSLEESGTIQNSRNKIENNPEEITDIGKIAAQSYTSKYHFIRKFREISGLTPHKFQIQSRIRMAQRMLLDGKSVAQTAQATGFYDQSHFDRYFKRIVGISPIEYVSAIIYKT